MKQKNGIYNGNRQIKEKKLKEVNDNITFTEFIDNITFKISKKKTSEIKVV